MEEGKEHNYQLPDAVLDMDEENKDFDLMRFVHEGNIEALQQMGAKEVVSILLAMGKMPTANAELESGNRTDESMLVTHFRDYAEGIQNEKVSNWHKPFLSFLAECGFSNTEVRAVLNTHFYWNEDTRTVMDNEARALGAPPIFSGYSTHDIDTK